MSRDQNVVAVVGRLVRKPDLRYTPAGKAICTMSIATNRDWGENKEVSYFDITAWGKIGENCGEYLDKGKRIAVEGYLKQDRWQDKTTGNNRSKVGIVAGSIQFLDARETQTKVTHEEQQENPPEDSDQEVPA